MNISEKDFETTIEEALLGQGYLRRRPEDYDRALCLDPELVFDFVRATQPKEWERLKRQHGADVKPRFLSRLAKEIRRRGTLEVLRKGIKDSGSRFHLAYFSPSSGLNPELARLYETNAFSVARQLHFSERDEKSLDLVLFLNGLPIFTCELKNTLTGQDVQDAIGQYRHDRDPREPLFAFGRCLAHFAVDPAFVYMTTKLEGSKTWFLPFNRGYNGGAGNPPSWNGYPTSYLWEEVWSKDSVLNLVQHFVQIVEEEDDKGKKTGKKKLIFPRYHQLDSVRRLVEDARSRGPGHRYLIQHSAGSGKSNSIAWLAHQLSVLHDSEDRRVFDSIVVITDRRVLDRQLQRNVRQFEQTLGVVENIDTTSCQLKRALEDGKTIIVTTLQKFPVIADEIKELSGHRFAVIIDEAHSSQSGESTKSMKKALMAKSLEEAEAEDSEGGEMEDLEERIAEEMKSRGPQPNTSFFAFTATPKNKTLELFGNHLENGRFEPFSLYTMRQAIEERFILDVLENYTTYKTYWSLLKKIEDDPRYDRKKATFLLKSYVDLHEHAIASKVEIIADHFAEKVASKISRKAKAMIVTRSRLHAVRYKLEMDRHLKEKGYDFKALVAFSGTVHDGGLDYTEANMNGFPETRTAEIFKSPENRFLVVASKFQTGFDQPLLHTMYVDKKLGGVNAVQTLSRLNRVHPGKTETMVLDFTNEADEILEAFEPYYEKTILKEGTDPNLLYDRETALENFDFYTRSEVDRFAKIYYDRKSKQEKLHSALKPAIDRYKDATKERQIDFRSELVDYIRLYAFLSQIITFVDTDLEKLYVFGKTFLRAVPAERGHLPREIQENIDMDSYRIQKSHDGKISLPGGASIIDPILSGGGKKSAEEETEPLSQIIRELNERFGTDFTEDDKVFIRQLEEKLARDAVLENSVQVNTRENARLAFDTVVNDRVQEMIDSNFKMYKQINDNKEFANMLLDWLFNRYMRSITD